MERRRETDMCILRIYSNLRVLVSRYARRYREYIYDLNHKDLTEQQKEMCQCHVIHYKAMHWQKIKELENIITFKCDTKQQRHERH
jgi:hypothetical protein